MTWSQGGGHWGIPVWWEAWALGAAGGGGALGFVPKSEYEVSHTSNYRSLITGPRAALWSHLSPHPRQASPGVPRCSQPVTKHRGDTEGGGWVQGLKRLDDKAPGLKINESPGDATYSTEP